MSLGEIFYSLLFKPLQLIFEVIYVFAYDVIGNPGLAIIVLSIVMNFLVLPLYIRADAIQEEERKIEAKMRKGVTHIKKTFRGDEKMMMLQTYYRQNGYKPTYVLRSAVSLLLEIPFFIAAYRFLSGLELLKGVPFGPIADLGAQDQLIRMGNITINVLPIIMTAVNLISCVIFTKGAAPKTKIQLYSMAIFFLFFLYTSPSGLVFYWTLNNLFSLIKTIFYNLKNPGKVLGVVFSISGIILGCAAVFVYKNPSMAKRLFILCCGVAFQLPLAYQVFKSKIKFNINGGQYKPDSRVFHAGGLFLSILTGITIPASVIKSSAQEFVNINHYQNPIWFIVGSFCIAFGTFVIWFGIFYRLAKPAVRVYFDRIIWVICGIAVANYMFFGNKLGTLSPSLTFETNIRFGLREILINGIAMVVLAVSYYILCKYHYKRIFKVALVFILALSVMVPVDVLSINSQIKDINKTVDTGEDKPRFTMYKNGKNVVVIMLDRAMGEYVPYIFNEKPELKEKFAGFTAYTNVVSFGGVTNTGSPALLGGYEYTPLEMNKRSDELLVTKHNEALKVMPVLFDQNNFDVTVFDPVYANYQWIPDLSVFDDYPKIKRYITKGKFGFKESSEAIFNQWYKRNMRNFFCYSIMKISPVAFQSYIYNNGNYYTSEQYIDNKANVQTVESVYKAKGLPSEFLKSYCVLDNMPNITKIDDGSKNSFMFMANDTTHEPVLLQLPDYVLSEEVDNTEYHDKFMENMVVNGRRLDMDFSLLQVTHYHSNMAAFLKLGEWLDYLRENGVYDNTRIILVSDHGRPLWHDKNRYLPDGTDTEIFYPLLMVKDFGATEFTFSDEFMTNADVPTLATKGIINNPKNPFTGKEINNSAKSQPLYIFSTDIWNVSENNGKTYKPGDWYRLSNGNMHDINNWEEAGKNTVLPDIN